MANELENTNSINSEMSDELDFNLEDLIDDEENPDEDVEAIKAKNRKLYARAKKAEGFIKTSDGLWVKPTPKPEVVTPPANVKVEGETKEEKVYLTPEEVDARVAATLMERDLNSLDVNEDLRAEVKKYAQLNNVSVQQAFGSKYIQFMKSEYDQSKKVEEASISTKRKSQSKTDFADAKPSDFDLQTPEGREGWANYKKWLKDS